MAFTIESTELNSIGDGLRRDFLHWFGSQDMQTWRPHITIQNKVSVAEASKLHRELAGNFHPHDIDIMGLDLWRYLDGPWTSEPTMPFAHWFTVTFRAGLWARIQSRKFWLGTILDLLGLSSRAQGKTQACRGRRCGKVLEDNPTAIAERSAAIPSDVAMEKWSV